MYELIKKLSDVNDLEDLFQIALSEEEKARNEFIKKFGMNAQDMLENKKLIIFGNGRYGQEIAEDLDSLGYIPYRMAEGLTNRIGKKTKWGEVISIEDILELKSEIVVIISIHLGAKIAESLKEHNVPYIYYDTGGYVGYIQEPCIMKHRAEMQLAYNKLEDDFSKKVLRQVLIARMFPSTSSHICGNMFVREIVTASQYFDQEYFSYANDEVFIDCGAYDGDTTMEFFKLAYMLGLNNAEAIVLEPDKNNYELTLKRLNEGKFTHIKVLNAGVGNRKGKKAFNCYGTNEAYMQDPQVWEIDDLLKLIKSEHLFIKMDIEGFEKEALLGAEKTLKTLKPKLAIACYHFGKDLYELLLFIHKMNPDYRFFLRHHQDTTVFETILYCY